MLITNHFILINLPKTGSTFARQVISDLYRAKRREYGFARRFLRLPGSREVPYCRELLLERTDFQKGYNYRFADQHGRYEQVPGKHRSKPVLSVVREPIERNYSFYEYGWWKDHPVAPAGDIRKAFPSWPDLDFGTYLEYQDFNRQYRDTGAPIPHDIGNQTVSFFQFFFRQPKAALARLSDEYIFSGAYRRDMPELHLLRTECLNTDLHDYLVQCGFTHGELGFVLEKPAVRPENTSRKSASEREKYMTEEARALIRHRERYLYRIYSDHGIDYPAGSGEGNTRI